MSSASSETMKGVVWEGKPFHMAVKDVKKPRIEHKNDAIVRITTAAICGTDLHTYHGLLGSTEPPWVMGHEAIGTVVEVGLGCSFIKVGERVVIPAGPDDGHLNVKPTASTDMVFYGEGPDFGDLGGCQAEYVRVPFADQSLIPITKNKIGDREYLFLSDIWPTAWTCLDFSGFKAGDSVAVFGCGPVGLLCAYSALLRGASRVYSIDHVKQRLDKAASIGAIPIDLTEGNPSEQILAKEPFGVTRSCDCCGYECVNGNLKPQKNFIITEAINVTVANGGIGVVGVYYELPKTEGTPLADRLSGTIEIPFSTAFIKNLSIKSGISDAKQLAEKLLTLVNTEKAKPGFVVSAEIGIEEAPEGYRRFDKHLETKVVIRFPWESHGKEEAETAL